EKTPDAAANGAQAPAPRAPSPEEPRIKKLAAVREAIGSDQITRAVDSYLKTFPWPTELDFLSAALEHRDEDVVREALCKLGPALAAGKPRRAAVLAGR